MNLVEYLVNFVGFFVNSVEYLVNFVELFVNSVEKDLHLHLVE